MSHLTTHVLDAAAGAPAPNMVVSLARHLPGGGSDPIAQGFTDADGRLALGPDRLDAGIPPRHGDIQRRDLQRRRRRPAPARAGAAQPVRLFDLPWELAMNDVTVSLGANKYGKAENRVVRIYRDSPRHEIVDLNVSSQLRGAALADSYLTGDNALVVATDTQKNTAFAFAKQHGVPSPEQYLLKLSEHFVGEFDWIEGGLWQAEQYEWERILVDGRPHDHSFVRKGQGTRLAAVQVIDGATHVTGGVKDLTVLKSTGSEFAGFPRDRYTTLVETDDRIMATSVTGRWRFLPEAVDAGIDYNGLYAEVSAVLLSTFATVHSLALQQTLFAMGKAAIQARPEIAEVRFAMPNKHHFLSDLSPFGLENPGEVFYAADRPYGLIEGTITRDGAAPAPDAWRDLPAFV
jgi:urate oxidase